MNATKKKTRPILEMANAIGASLPCDGYSSKEEWLRRYSERLKDGGYTPSEIEAMTGTVMRRAEMRERAKLELDTLLDRRAKTDDAESSALLLKVLKSVGLFTSLRPGRDLARLTKHLQYFITRSSRIRDAYRYFVSEIAAQTQLESVQEWLAHNAKASDAFAKLYGYKLWRARPDSPLSFYERTAFITCSRTNESVPTAAAIQVVVDETGLTRRMHPKLADDTDLIVRDAISGSLVLRGAVEWITLDTGELCWKRFNERLGQIVFDEEQQHWMRKGRGQVAGYHGARRDWRSGGNFRGCIGVELEVGFKSADTGLKFVNRFADERGRFVGNRPFLVENDSSLSGIPGGVEIISEPLPLYEGYQAPDAHWRWLLERLVQGGAEGWKHRARAGIHVNMDVSDKKANQVVRFIAFINNAASLSRFIAGRKAIFGADAGGGSAINNAELDNLKDFESKDKNAATGGYLRISKDYLTGHGTGRFDSNMLSHFRGRGKYQPVNVRRDGSVLEVRIFGSNIRYEGFMACVEYCVAGMAFVGQLENDEAVMAADIGTQFRTWLSRNVAMYPNLASRIGVEESTETVVARPLQELVA